MFRLAAKGNQNAQFMRSDFQEKVLERASTTHFLLYFWLAMWRSPWGSVNLCKTREGLCLGSGGLSQRSHVGLWLSGGFGCSESSPLLFLFISYNVPTSFLPDLLPWFICSSGTVSVSSKSLAHPRLSSVSQTSGQTSPFPRDTGLV